MISFCRAYLTEKLKEAGIRTKVFTSLKQVEISQDPRIGAVLFDVESLERDGSKKIYKDQEEATHKRRKVFRRETTFAIIIGDPVPDMAEQIFETFLLLLDKGVYINGNYTKIEISEAEWVDEKDSILKSKIAVNLKVTFIGGVYKDSNFAKLKRIEIIDINKEVENHGESVGE